MLKLHQQNSHYISHYGCEVIHDYNKLQTVNFCLFDGKRTSLNIFLLEIVFFSHFHVWV